jgi:hypothetical protein
MKKFITMILVLGILLCCSVVAYADTGAAPDILNDLNALNMTLVLGVLGVLAFAVELIVELTKELPGIKSIPTQLYAIIVSLIVCILALFIYAAYATITVLWYYIALAVFMGFVVSYISMYGWDTLNKLYSRYKK